MSERMPHSEMAEIMTGLVAGKGQWLAKHADKHRRRPDWNIELIRREKRALEQARDDYRRAADRGRT